MYAPVASLAPSSNVVCALSIAVSCLHLKDSRFTFPSFGLILKVTVSPDVVRFSTVFSHLHNKGQSYPPGAPDPGPLITTMENCGGGGEVVTVAVPDTLTVLSLLSVAVIVYEPVALAPSSNVVCARPLLPVVALVVPRVTFPSFGLTLKVTP